MEAKNDNYDNEYARSAESVYNDASASSPLEEKAKDDKVLGSAKVSRFLSRSVREGSWLNWGLVILIGAALFAIYKIMSVILYFVR